jgi:hypothetical protein
MFERKNQNVLAPHFSALVTHEGADEADDDDGFLTLKHRDHTLQDVGLADNANDDDGNPQAAGSSSAEMLSKRKLKMGESKKAMLKLKSSGHKVIFDDQGGAHEMYEMEGEADFAKRGDAESQRREYLEINREVMKEADVEDRRVAREKRQEKKRKRKDREREEVSLACDRNSRVDVYLVANPYIVVQPHSERPKPRTTGAREITVSLSVARPTYPKPSQTHHPDRARRPSRTRRCRTMQMERTKRLWRYVSCKDELDSDSYDGLLVYVFCTNVLVSTSPSG